MHNLHNLHYIITKACHEQQTSDGHMHIIACFIDRPYTFTQAVLFYKAYCVYFYVQYTFQLC